MGKINASMEIERLLQFALRHKLIEKFPHYFIGSNADLPIVGGSILSHEHFQGEDMYFLWRKLP